MSVCWLSRGGGFEDGGKSVKLSLQKVGAMK